MKIFLTSDQHFGHQNIIKYCNRPFDFSLEGVIDCIKTIFERYNEKVSDDDIVFHLGDVAFLNKTNKDMFKTILKNLKGKKILIRGNHDKFPDSFYEECGFLAVEDYIILGDYFLCHYPLNENQIMDPKMKGLRQIFDESNCLMIFHGHTHEKSPTDNEVPRINVCVDNPENDFYPVEISDKDFKKHAEKYLNSINNVKKGF